MHALVSKLLAVKRPGRSLKALGGHPLAFTNVGQYWGRYGRVVRSSSLLFPYLRHPFQGVFPNDY